jgi:hypothetical protein
MYNSKWTLLNGDYIPSEDDFRKKHKWMII